MLNFQKNGQKKLSKSFEDCEGKGIKRFDLKIKR